MARGGGGGGGGGGTTASTPTSRPSRRPTSRSTTTGSWARSTAASTTDFAAPAIDVPTFRRTFSRRRTAATTGTTTTTIAGDPANHLTFTQVGTSMSAAIVTGAYALVASALDYWISLSHANGVTSDAYLTQPVGRELAELRPARPQGPVGLQQPRRHQRHPRLHGRPGRRRQRPRLAVHSASGRHDGPAERLRGRHPAAVLRPGLVGNAIASIEGRSRSSTCSTTTTSRSSTPTTTGSSRPRRSRTSPTRRPTKGLAEAGAMARLLGGTATTRLAGVGPEQHACSTRTPTSRRSSSGGSTTSTTWPTASSRAASRISRSRCWPTRCCPCPIST